MKKKTKDKGIYGVIGLGRFGRALAQGLATSGAEVIVVDREESKVNDARAYTEYAYVIHNLSRQNLEDVGLREGQDPQIRIPRNQPQVCFKGWS